MTPNLKEDRHQLINFELELLELLVADENMQILVPFFFRNHWILVMRRLVNGKLLFFYCDSDETTKKKFTGGRSIPECPLKLLANTPLWPIGVN
jgi:hypothetical protein